MKNEVEEKILEIFRKCLTDVNLDDEKLVEAPLSTLNLDSITFIKIIVEVEMEFDIEIEPEELDATIFYNIRSFVQHVEEMLT